MKLYNIIDPTNHDDHWAANKGYVDKKLTINYLLLAVLSTGPVDVTGDARIKTKDDEGNVTSTLYPSGLIDSKMKLGSTAQVQSNVCCQERWNS